MKPPSANRTDPGISSPRLTDAERKLQIQIERLERQFDQLRQQIRQSQQLASLGTAAAMLAHEYNNLMTPAVGYARYALDSDDHELMIRALNMTLRQGAIVSAMADRILGLAIQEAQSFQAVDLKAVVQEAVACMGRDPAKDGITLRINIDEGLKVRADEKQLIQVFFNLLLNARQAITGHGGRITVDASTKGDDQVEIRVRDTGGGIPPDILDTIFDPFVTSKSRSPDGSDKGAGLGLAICRDIIQEHRGDISAESEPDRGTTFTITLPVSD